MGHVINYSSAPGLFSSRGGWPRRILVPSSPFLAAEAGAEDVAGGEPVPERGRRVLPRTRPCGHGRTLPFGGCSGENCCVASVWVAGGGGSLALPSPVWELRQHFFFNLCVYFWLLTKGSTVPSCHSVNWNLSTQHTSSAAQAEASRYC